MIPDKEDLYQLGYFTKLHGYKGELTAFLDTTELREYEGLEHLFLDVKGQLIPYAVGQIEFKTNKSVKVKLEGVDTEEDAKGLVGARIYIDKSDISEADEERIELKAIEGYKVIDAVKGPIGIVELIDDNSTNPLLQILHTETKKVILIPLHPDFIHEVDAKKKELHISAPEGLIDFYLEQE